MKPIAPNSAASALAHQIEHQRSTAEQRQHGQDARDPLVDAAEQQPQYCHQPGHQHRPFGKTQPVMVRDKPIAIFDGAAGDRDDVAFLVVEGA
jgi:hypothetical protein